MESHDPPVIEDVEIEIDVAEDLKWWMVAENEAQSGPPFEAYSCHNDGAAAGEDLDNTTAVERYSPVQDPQLELEPEVKVELLQVEVGTSHCSESEMDGDTMHDYKPQVKPDVISEPGDKVEPESGTDSDTICEPWACHQTESGSQQPEDTDQREPGTSPEETLQDSHFDGEPAFGPEEQHRAFHFHVVSSASEMASGPTQNRSNLKETLELVAQEGSDIEDDEMSASEEEESDTSLDSGDEYVPGIDYLEDSASEADDMTTTTRMNEREPPTMDFEEDEENSAPYRPPPYRVGESHADSVDESDDEGMYEWVRDLHNFPMNAPFTGTSGLQLPETFPSSPTPLDFYRLFINQDMIKLFKTETNRYAASAIAEAKAARKLSARSMYSTWRPVTLAEMTKFLAILIHMGVVKKPHILDYWSTDPALHTSFAPRLMKRSRFCSILSFFHLNNNATYVPSGRPGHDPLHKLRPLFDHLKQAFTAVYQPEEDICIDEDICPWRGKLAFCVFMRDKPIKWGMKLQELCEASSGYVCNFEVMCYQPGVSNAPYAVVTRLLDPFKQRGHTLYVDRDYSSPKLAADLAAENTAVVGTVRADCRGRPEYLMRKHMARGKVDYRRKNQVLWVRWRDKREVNMLTTKHLPIKKRVQSRKEKTTKPVCVVDYIKNMAGVDRYSQMIAYLPLHRKSIKWWKKLALHLLTLTMLQAHCLYNKHRKQGRQTAMPLVSFVLSVCNGLAGLPLLDEDALQTAAVVRRQINSEDRLRSEGHFPEAIPPKNNRRPKGQSQCKVCYSQMRARGVPLKIAKTRRKLTTFQCDSCKVPLCPAPCFKLFHTVKDFQK